jgi:type IX secretion system substrate protein
MRKQPCFLSISLFVLFLFALFLGTAISSFAQTNYYSKSTGNLDQLSTWGTLTNGSGLPPLTFTTNNQVFNVRNNATPTIGANWTVSGAGSKIIVGDGTNACNFQIPSTFKYTGTADVAANATLSIANTSIPTLGTLNVTSTVVYNGTANQAIPLATYGNMTYAGSAFGTMVAGGCTIKGTLSVTNGTLQLDNYTTQYTYTVGNLIVTTSGLLDLGSNGGNTGQPATINLSGNLTQSGTGQIYCTGFYTPNATINFTGTNQNIQQASSDYVNYNVMSGSTCTLTGNFSYDGENTAAVFYGTFTVTNGGTLNCGPYVVYGYSKDNLTDPYNIFVLNSGGNISTGNPDGISSSGSIGTIQTQNSSFSSGANYTYNGIVAQNTGVFSTTGSTLNNLTINNTSGGVTLSQAQNLNGALTLTNGLLNTTSTNLITLNNNATTSGASNNSFVNGPIQKIGKQAIIFPVGSAGTGYVPIGISAPASTSDAFLAQYNRSSAVALGPITAIGLNHVSSCDYWILNHTAGASSVNVTGYWSAVNPCGGTYINNLPTLALAHFNGTSWNAWGYNGTTGTVTAGSVTWNNVSNFSPFSLASTSVMNPLPITLTDFNAQWNPDGTVGLSWRTQEEVNSSHFNIQRSADQVTWQTVGNIPAKGNSTTEISYSFTDIAPIPNLDYYRLQIVDLDGNNFYSDIKTVSAQIKNIRIFPNPANDHINITLASGSLAGTVTIRLINVEGKVLLQKEVSNIGGQTITLPVSMYPQGVYLVQVMTPGNVQQSGTVIIRRN